MVHFQGLVLGHLSAIPSKVTHEVHKGLSSEVGLAVDGVCTLKRYELCT